MMQRPETMNIVQRLMQSAPLQQIFKEVGGQVHQTQTQEGTAEESTSTTPPMNMEDMAKMTQSIFSGNMMAELMKWAEEAAPIIENDGASLQEPQQAQQQRQEQTPP